MAITQPLKNSITASFAVIVFILSGYLLLRSFNEDDQPIFSEKSDQCLSCHQDVQNMSVSHPNRDFGCYTCHLGNPYATDEKTAHAGIVRNPSDLLWADKTCGKIQCHLDLTHTVSNSIMTSNTGLAASTLYQWDERATPDDSTLNIDLNIPDTSLATSHLRKLCAGCHINKRENDLPGETGRRGGGCNDCHLVKNTNPDIHPTFSVQIGNEVCVKCHNRSDRIGLTYQGKFESEGYGTPYDGGNLSSMELSGNRYYYHISADIHFEAGMVCIDCHIAEDIMGDGHKYQHLEEQVHIRCEDCHQARFKKPADNNIVYRIISVNPNLQMPADTLFAFTKKESFYANVIIENDKPTLIRKLDGRRLPIPQNSTNPDCNMPGHERLSCQACHSAYIPQCYGCHDVYDPTQKQMDKVSYQETYGHWSEGRSYLRFEKPTLGVNQSNLIMPFAPGCQVFFTELNDALDIKQQKIWLTMAAFDPHSTRKPVPECIDCHSDPKRLGLGNGNLELQDGQFIVNHIYDSRLSGLGNDDLEMMVDSDGKTTQRMSRLAARPFTIDEIKKIYMVSLCIICHDRATDRIYADFEESIKKYKRESSLPCRKDNE